MDETKKMLNFEQCETIEELNDFNQGMVDAVVVGTALVGVMLAVSAAT